MADTRKKYQWGEHPWAPPWSIRERIVGLIVLVFSGALIGTLPVALGPGAPDGRIFAGVGALCGYAVWRVIAFQK